MEPHEEIEELQNDAEESNEDDKIFSTEEIKIEELAIDGICGVY
jgi:mycofactocin precursor